MKKINIFGDSHVAILRDAIGGKSESAGKNIWRQSFKNITFDFYNRDGRAWRKFTYLGSDKLHLKSQLNIDIKEDPIDFIIDLQKNDELFIFSGIMHTPMTYGASDWKDGLIPWWLNKKIPSYKKLASTDVLHHMIYSNVELMLNFLKTLKKKGLKLGVLDSPRPLRRSHILHRVDNQLIIPLDRLHREVVLHHLKQNNIEIILTPSEAFDGDGFQKQMYSAQDESDPHHGSSRWGTLMLDELVRRYS